MTKTVISETLRLHVATLSDHFCDPGVHRDTQQVQGVHFSILGCILGVSWDLRWRNVCGFSLIVGANVRDSFQVNVSDDPGMEMLPGSGWMYVL